MRRLRGVTWSVLWLAAVGGIAAAIVLALTHGEGIIVALTLGSSIIAALAASAGTFITWRGNQETARQQRQMAADVRRLAELTQSSIEEARAQKPEPAVFFDVKGEGSAGAVLVRKRLDREVDVERIVAVERERALATLPKPPKPKAEQTDQAEIARLAPGLAKLLDQAGTYDSLARSFGFGPSGPATAEERAEFEARVETYLGRVRQWLRAYEEWHRAVHELVSFKLRFENTGRVPARDVRVEVHFPDPFEEGPDDYPIIESPPVRPTFARKNRFGIPDIGISPSLASLAALDRVGPIRVPQPRNVSRPRYRRGSVFVDIEITKLLHGVYEESDTLTLRLPQDGTYRIPWQIHAENLGEPTRGELEFQLKTEIETGPPIFDLDELRRAVEPDDDSDD